jgi:integrase
MRMCREVKRRVRWITLEQAKTLLAELPEHQRDMLLFSLATGLRQGNVLALSGRKWTLNAKPAGSPRRTPRETGRSHFLGRPSR